MSADFLLGTECVPRCFDGRLYRHSCAGRMQSMIAHMGAAMTTTLVVRNIDEDLARVLKQRAASHRRSAEAKHREILKNTLLRPQRRSFAEVLAMGETIPWAEMRDYLASRVAGKQVLRPVA